jgi:hypothetical protein
VTFTVASGNPVSDGVAVGDIVSVYTIAGASVATCLIRVTSRTSTTIVGVVIAGAAANVSASAAASTAIVGGAWDGPVSTTAFPFNFAAATMLDASNNPPRVNFQNGTTYEITAAMTHSLPGPTKFEGYASAAGDFGRAKFGGDSASPTTPYVMLTLSGAGCTLKYLWFDDNGGTTAGQTVLGMLDVTAPSTTLDACWFSNAYRDGVRIAGGASRLERCGAWDNQRDDASAHGNYLVTEECSFVLCWSDYTGSPGTDSSGWVIGADSTEPVTFDHCSARRGGAHGIEMTGNHNAVSARYCNFTDNAQAGVHGAWAAATAQVVFLSRCLFANNGTWGVSAQNATQRTIRVSRCAFWSNASGEVEGDINPSGVTGSITLTNDPFEDRANGDFRLNDDPVGGALCQNVFEDSFNFNTALSGLSSGALSTSCGDIGMVQTELPNLAAIALAAWVTTTPRALNA